MKTIKEIALRARKEAAGMIGDLMGISRRYALERYVVSQVEMENRVRDIKRQIKLQRP